MPRPTNSGSYPPEMLELLLRVGANADLVITLPFKHVKDANDLRTRFYSLRGCLKKEKYSEFETVAAVRFCLDGTNLRVENTNKFHKDPLDNALAAGIAQLNQLDEERASGQPRLPLGELPIPPDAGEHLATGETADEAELARLAGGGAPRIQPGASR